VKELTCHPWMPLLPIQNLRNSMALTFGPLTLGTQTFSSNLIQGPLAGVSCWPFRLLATQWGAPGFCYTEMLSAKNLATHAEISPRFRIKHPEEGPLCVQLSGTDPEELARATERVINFGADLIDLNCGCPVTKIRKKGAGSKLLETPDLLADLIKAIKSQSKNLPISIKIRLGPHSLLAALRAQDAGVDFITIHGRQWTEHYETPADPEGIFNIIQSLDIPVIANGDVNNTESALALLKQTGASGIMIARGSVGRPWLFNQIKQEALGEIFIPPDNYKIGQLLLEHIQGLISLEGEKIAVLQARKLIKYYARAVNNLDQNLDPNNFENLLIQAQKLTHFLNLEKLVQDFFK